MNDNQRKILRDALAQMEAEGVLVWGPKSLEEVAPALRALLDENAALKHDAVCAQAEIGDLRADLAAAKADLILTQVRGKRFRAEVAALKAKPDPLAEMWRELAEYQPQADKDGHGESWARMCSERTDHSARAAARAAARYAAQYAAWDAALDAARAAARAGEMRAVEEACWDAGRAAAVDAKSARDAIAAIRRAKEGEA